MNTFSKIFLVFLISFNIYADLPLTLEDLITDKGKFKLDLNLTYANSEQNKLLVGDPILIAVSSTSFVSIPTLIGERKINFDTLITSIGMRYGLTGKAEIYARANYLYNEWRTQSPEFNNHQTNNFEQFTDAWLGLNYEFKEDKETPAFLGFIEAASYEKHLTNKAYFKSYLLGFTTYTAFDPLVFSLTSAYRLNQKRQDNKKVYRPGNFLIINPQIGFAVNDKATLTYGVQWLNRFSDKLDNIKTSYRQTKTDLTLGLGFGFNENSTLNVNFRASATNNNSADIRIGWLYKF